ncbi:MAG: hypothetical protein WC819_03605 [Parcubacteria group bacterium]
MSNEIECRNDLFWRQLPEHSGRLTANGNPDHELIEDEIITKVFTRGKKYPITLHIDGSDRGDVDIVICACSDDGKLHQIILAIDVRVTEQKLLDHFIF